MDRKKNLATEPVSTAIRTNFNVRVQYPYTENAGFTESLFGKNEHCVQVSLVYFFSKIFNKQFGDREELLRMKQNYLI